MVSTGMESMRNLASEAMIYIKLFTSVKTPIVVNAISRSNLISQ